MRKCFTYKLYFSKKNKKLGRDIDLACDVYNHCITLHRRYFSRYKRHLSLFTLQKHITKIKNRYKCHWQRLGSQAIQDITERVDRAYKLFFSNLKKKKKCNPPKFKSRYKYKSFTLKQAGWKLDVEKGQIRIGKQVYRYHNKERKVDGQVKTITVKRNSLGEYFLFISVVLGEEMLKKRTMTGKSAGLDFGIGTFMHSSDGNKFLAPKQMQSSFEKLKAAQRKFSKKKRGSNNRKKAKMDLIRLHEKIENQRADWQWKLSLDLVRRYDKIFLEDLSFVNMQNDTSLEFKGQKKSRNRKLLDLSPASFIDRLQKKAVEHGVEVAFVDRWFPTTKMCSNCLSVKSDLQQWERRWICPGCGVDHDRDENAAKNILREGASSLGLKKCT